MKPAKSDYHSNVSCGINGFVNSLKIKIIYSVWYIKIPPLL